MKIKITTTAITAYGVFVYICVLVFVQVRKINSIFDCDRSNCFVHKSKHFFSLGLLGNCLNSETSWNNAANLTFTYEHLRNSAFSYEDLKKWRFIYENSARVYFESVTIYNICSPNRKRIESIVRRTQCKTYWANETNNKCACWRHFKSCKIFSKIRMHSY